jgi:hypothetical protein
MTKPKKLTVVYFLLCYIYYNNLNIQIKGCRPVRVIRSRPLLKRRTIVLNWQKCICGGKSPTSPVHPVYVGLSYYRWGFDDGASRSRNFFTKWFWHHNRPVFRNWGILERPPLRFERKTIILRCREHISGAGDCRKTTNSSKNYVVEIYVEQISRQKPCRRTIWG